jgi:transcriptional regulator with XRE-family HTH domain
MAYLRHPEFMKVFGENLRRVRVAKCMSQDEVAFSSHLSTNQIGRIERGEINAGLSTIYELAQTLGVPVHELFQFEA